jgi:hypothetical protein
MRKVIRAASVLLSALAIPAAVLVAPLPASAAPGESICEAFGNNYCLNSSNFNSFTPVLKIPLAMPVPSTLMGICLCSTARSTRASALQPATMTIM